MEWREQAAATLLREGRTVYHADHYLGVVSDPLWSESTLSSYRIRTTPTTSARGGAAQEAVSRKADTRREQAAAPPTLVPPAPRRFASTPRSCTGSPTLQRRCRAGQETSKGQCRAGQESRAGAAISLFMSDSPTSGLGAVLMQADTPGRLEAQGPSRTCNESKDEEEEDTAGRLHPRLCQLSGKDTSKGKCRAGKGLSNEWAPPLLFLATSALLAEVAGATADGPATTTPG